MMVHSTETSGCSVEKKLTKPLIFLMILIESININLFRLCVDNSNASAVSLQLLAEMYFPRQLQLWSPCTGALKY